MKWIHGRRLDFSLEKYTRKQIILRIISFQADFILIFFTIFGDSAYQQLLCNTLNEFIKEKNPDTKKCIYIVC